MSGGFDLDAAGLRADGRDLATQIEALAVRLEGALPSATRVRRRARGLFSKERRVSEIEVGLGEAEYLLRCTADGVECTRGRTVHGVQIKREELGLVGWLEALTADLRERAQESAEARTALDRLLT